TLAANCIWRLSPTVVVMRPAVGEPMLALGKPSCGVLSRLKASARSWRFRRWRRGMRLASDTSRVFVPGAYRIPRPASPYVLGGGATKSATLNHTSGVGLSSFPLPRRLGHDGAPLLTPVFRKTVKGRPVA